MNFDITRQSLFRTILYFTAMFIIFRSREYLFIPYADPPEMMPLGSFVYDFLQRMPVLETGITFILAFVNSFYVTSIISRNLIFLERTYMPSLVYLMVSLGYYSSGTTAIVLSAALLLALAANNMIMSFKQSLKLGYFFKASILLGLATVIYAPSVVFAAFLIVGLMIFRGNFRDSIVSFAGFLIPLFFASYIDWGTGGEFRDTSDRILEIISSPAGRAASIGAWDYVLLSVFMAILILSFITFLRRKEGMRKRSYYAYTLFVWMFLISAGMFALPCRNLEMLPVIAIPVSVIIPTYFNRRQGLIPNLLYALITLSLLIYNIIPFVS